MPSADFAHWPNEQLRRGLLQGGLLALGRLDISTQDGSPYEANTA
jgi:hypothetical protein